MNLQDKNFKVSVITVVFNASQVIEKTLNSILTQTYTNTEFIIIDGGSDDGTIEIIDKHRKHIDHFISEKDSGIYDAMNKGIQYATGDWICFMNAGDTFFNTDTIKDLFYKKEISHDILAGDCIADYKSFTKYLKAKDLQKIIYGMTFCHQSSFVRANMFQKLNFNSEFKISSDFDFFYRCYLSKAKIKMYRFPFSIINTEGVSNKLQLQVIFENREIYRKHSKSYAVVEFIYLLKIVWTFFKYVIKKILPESLSKFIKKII